MDRSKITKIVFVIAIIVLAAGGIYWWQSVSRDLVQDEADSQNYSNDKFRISFSYPKQLFLLDRLNEDKRIYVSPREISYNDLAGGYYTPIEVSLTDESRGRGDSLLDSLTDKKVSQSIINGKNALIISGVAPEEPPYYAFDVFAIIFPEQKVSIIAANRFKQDNSIDLETMVRKISASLR